MAAHLILSAIKLKANPDQAMEMRITGAGSLISAWTAR